MENPRKSSVKKIKEIYETRGSTGTKPNFGINI